MNVQPYLKRALFEIRKSSELRRKTFGKNVENYFKQ